MPRNVPITHRLEAAALLARDVPVAEIAHQMGVSRWTIVSWAKTDEAQSHIAAIKSSVREATKALAVADKVRRIQYAQTMRDGVDALIAARRAAGSQINAIGAETGQVAVKVTTTEVRGRVTTTYEAAFDASLHDQARKWSEYAAKELDDLESNVNVRHSGRVDHVISRPDLSVLSDEELESLLPLAEKVAAGEVDR
jgi:IS30 family transposase